MMTYYKGNQSGGIIGVLPGPPPNPPNGCMLHFFSLGILKHYQP